MSSIKIEPHHRFLRMSNGIPVPKPHLNNNMTAYIYSWDTKKFLFFWRKKYKKLQYFLSLNDYMLVDFQNVKFYGTLHCDNENLKFEVF